MENKNYEFGMIGLGVMGQNLLLNLADHGFSVTGHDRDISKVNDLEKKGADKAVKGFSDLSEFIDHLQKPRAVMLLVPAGKIVDQVIEDLLPLLDEGDLIIDGGNSYFADTDRRFKSLQEKNIHFFGMGISGGEEGARKGPSLMPGGDREAYLVVKDKFEAVSAKVNNEPCVAYLGPGACGHFVKMVHNGIEYGLMQVISEVYGIMRNHLGLNNKEIHEAFRSWNEGRLDSFLIEITADIFLQKDDLTDNMLIDMISDQAKSKGTGKWTGQLAMDLQVPVPTIDMAVAMRDISKFKKLRKETEKIYRNPVAVATPLTLERIEEALYFAFISTYSQGLHMLQVASDEFDYNLDLATISKIWRGGCIIRAKLLEDIYQAFHTNKSLQHLLIDETIHEQVLNCEKGMRTTLAQAILSGDGTPALSACLNYYDMLRKGNMPSNLIQAQRDYFGAHTYERSDREGIFHTEWQ